MQKQDPKKWIWVERYRPTNLDDYICTSSFRKRIESWINGDNNSHLFFESGTPGNGKTTIAKIIANSISSNVLVINASSDNGIDTVRNKIEGFVARKTLDGRGRVVILDEIDNMTLQAIKAMRPLIEEYVEYARFIVTCNDWSQVGDDKVREAFRNRFSYVNFDTVHGKEQEDRKDIGRQAYERCVKILEENNVEYEPQAILHVIKSNFGEALSIRGVIQTIQDLSLNGVTMDSIATNMNLKLDEILKFVARNDFKPVREFVHTNANRSSSIIRDLERNIDRYFDVKSENFLNVFFILRECLDRLKNSDLPEIPLICMFLELGAENVIHKSIRS